MRLTFLLLPLSLLVAACSSPPPDALIGDRYEPVNRQIHAFNKGLDKGVAKPASKLYSKVFSETDDQIIQNWGRMLSLPNRVANKLLQGRIGSALSDTARFGVNLTLGMAGMFDVAPDFGIPDEETDFGETLHKWGFKEGHYVELPVFGPSNERDAVGRVVDIFLLDPIGTRYPDARPVTSSVEILEQLSTRNAFAALIDDVLYNSEDSYLAQQLAYTQNRRFELSKSDEPTSASDDVLLEDPFSDF